jgi:hypothetical protein
LEVRPQGKQFLSRFPWEDFRTALSREAHNRLYDARLCILYHGSLRFAG